MAENGVKSEPMADSPTSVLDEEDCKENLADKVKVEDSSLVLNAMEEVEEKLKEERLKEEGEMNEPKKEPQLNETQFTKLDELLTQTQLYSEFLLEKMNDITKDESEDDGETDSEVKRSRGSKRKAGSSYGNGKAKRAVAAMLTRSKDDGSAEDLTLTDEERAEKEQAKLVPLLTGGKLKSYQIKGVKWMISLWQNGLNGILADQMGLGKTIQTISFLAHLKGNGLHGPYLIIAPLSTLSNWLTEIERFAPSLDAIIFHGDKKERTEIVRKYMPRTIGPNFPIIITSYEVALSDARRHLRHYSWKYLVVDEGHRLKNSKCKLVKELKHVSVENKLLLTGTPLQNNLAELWSLLNFILPDIFSSHEEFESWFDFSGKCNNEEDKEQLEEKRRAQVVAKLHAILRPFLLRRMKADVEHMLPMKKEIILYATLTGHQKNFQDHLVNRTLENHLRERTDTGVDFFAIEILMQKFFPNFLAAFLNGDSPQKSQKLGTKWQFYVSLLVCLLGSISHNGMKGRLNNLMVQLRKNCNHPDLLESSFDSSGFYPPVQQIIEQCGKFHLLDRLLAKLLARNHKVLIFSQWTKILDIMEYYFSEKGLEVCRIDGSVRLAERRRQINEFNDVNSDYKIFLLSTRAGGLGINLTAADTCILYDSDWNPQMDLQAMDRCHRIGQTKPVHVYRLSTAQSVEGRILRRAFSKLKLEHVVLGKGQFQQERSKADGIDTMTEEELLAILRDDEDEKDKWIQTDISDEDLEKVLDRSDLVMKSWEEDEKSTSKSTVVPLKGPGWEVVIPTATGGVLANLSS